MSYEVALKIVDVVNDIYKKNYLLPAIQREFVWGTDQIEKLFDSLMRDYPIGSFLLWKVEKENVKDYEFYEFIKDYHEKDNQNNPKANISGEEEITVILDGQQRLTALYLALKGTYSYRLPRKKWDNPKAYPPRTLYINLVDKYKEVDLEFDFKFLTKEEVKENDDSHYWFPVGEILNLKEPGDVIEYLLEFVFDNYTKERQKLANRILFKLHNVIYQQGTISYYLEKSQILDKVLNIFIRINSAGTELSYSDLLLSIATAQWEKKNTREEIILFVNEINNIGNFFNFNKDFILKSCLVLNDFTNIAFKVDNFNKRNMLSIEDNWELITNSIRQAVKLVSTFGYNRETLTSNNAIIPIAYYLNKISAKDNYASSSKNYKEKAVIKKWLILSLIKRTFGGQPDNVLRPIRKIIQENSGEYPLDKIINYFKGTNKTLVFSDEDIENLLRYKYGQGFTFSILTLLYPNLNFHNIFHIDHIFPKSQFTKVNLRKRGIPVGDVEVYQTHFNYLGNLQLLESTPNLEKLDKDFNAWLNKIYLNPKDRKEYRKNHLIPDVDLNFNNFIEFFEEREKLIIKKFKGILQPKVV